MNIYNRLPTDIQFVIDGILLKEQNDNKTIKVIEELNQRKLIFDIYQRGVDKLDLDWEEEKFKFVFLKVMPWALYGNKTFKRNGEEYVSKYKRSFTNRHKTINKNLIPLYNLVYYGNHINKTAPFKTGIRVGILWYLKRHYKSVKDIYPTLVDLNLNGIVDLLGLCDIDYIIKEIADKLYRHFSYRFDNLNGWNMD